MCSVFVHVCVRARAHVCVKFFGFSFGLKVSVKYLICDKVLLIQL